jgi:hypothetical protein
MALEPSIFLATTAPIRVSPYSWHDISMYPNRLPRSDPVLEAMGSASVGSCPMAEYVAISPSQYAVSVLSRNHA